MPVLEPGGAIEALRAARDTLVVAAPEPWAWLAPQVPAPAVVIEPAGMARRPLDARVAALPGVGSVVGIGGGTALDTAKYVAWRRGLPLLLIPSILSVDAAFTNTIGVREDGRVAYVGDVRPERIVVDPDLIRRAPKALNRAGIGDLLSCHTALCDWRISEKAGHPRGPAVAWDAGLGDLGASILDTLWQGAGDVAAVNAAGIALLADGFERVGAACRRAGHARFEEGAEHFLAYALEARSGRTFVHGELIALTTLLVSLLQGNAPERVAAAIERSRVRATPAHLGLTPDEIVETLVALPRYVREQDHWWSIADERRLVRSEATDLLEDAVARLPEATA